MTKIIRQWANIILSTIPDIMENGMTPCVTTLITDRVHHGLLLNIMENIIWNRCVSAMTSHTALFRCLQAETGSGGITL